MKQKYFLTFLLSFYFAIVNGQNNALQISNNTYFGCNQSASGILYNLDSNNFTIEYDFYLNSLTTYNARFTAFQNGNLSTIAKPIHFYVDNLGVSNLLLGNGTTEELVPGMPTFNAQQWYHIALVVTNTATKNVKVYVNGVLNVNFNFTSTLDGFDTQTLLNLGAHYSSSTNTGNAKFDNLRIWSTARTDVEIANNYSSCLTGNETGLVSLFNFDKYNGPFIKSLANNSFLNKIFYVVNSSYPNIHSYVPGSGCSVTPLYEPLTRNIGGTYYYIDQVNGKPYYKSDDIDVICGNNTSQAQCAGSGSYSEIIWENNQWILRSISCIWELGEACVPVAESNTVTNTADTPFPPCSGWSDNSTFSSSQCSLNATSHDLENNIEIYPNPTQNILNIDSKESIEIVMMNILGEIILIQNNIIGIQKINLDNFTSGIYILKVTNEFGKSKNFKIIKE